MPVEITSVSELQAMSSNLAGSYILMNDIDASATSGWNAGAGFVPVGTVPSPFTGTLNGDGYEITSLFIDRDAAAQGLFGGFNGTVQDLRLASASVKGGSPSGIAVGRIGSGLVLRVGVSGTALTHVATGNRNLGGITGFIDTGEIRDSYSLATVTGGDRTGGLVGDNRGTVLRCYAAGVVTGSGGLNGAQNGGTTTQSFWDTQTSGQATSDGGTGRTTAQMKDIDTYTTGGPTWNMVTVGSYVDEVWAIDDGEDYPILGFEVVAAPPSGTAFWRTRQSNQLSTAGVIG